MMNFFLRLNKKMKMRESRGEFEDRKELNLTKWKTHIFMANSVESIGFGLVMDVIH